MTVYVQLTEICKYVEDFVSGSLGPVNPFFHGFVFVAAVVVVVVVVVEVTLY